MESRCLSSATYTQKCVELDRLIRNHLIQCHIVIKALKTRLHDAEEDVKRLKHDRCLLMTKLTEEKSKCETLKSVHADLEKVSANEFHRQQKAIQERERELQVRTKHLDVRAKECERWAHHLKGMEDKLFAQQIRLESIKASLEGDMELVHRWVEGGYGRTENLGRESRHFLERSNSQALCTRHCRCDAEAAFCNERECFYLEKEETLQRLSIMQQELFFVNKIISSRVSHVLLVEENLMGVQTWINRKDFRDSVPIRTKGEGPVYSKLTEGQLTNSKGWMTGGQYVEYPNASESVNSLEVGLSLKAEESHLDRLKQFEKLLTMSLEE
ncbi:uncharacterized protein TEOVI_000827100 [Trypanosoma equiperdum]|uniref:Uncharacterized protein n=2 Tax=Trypanozoon TaxID=39700 RepID=Q38BH9_TRYB2|nr:hypothetical protein, conserved [Trypanosoma brucei brucei TREU927]EAN77841.1 hypothetical protein, conserved [Trypanosoma brucei brucei TREU927]SCU66475.1 hypothetical protein, conserved [Trypanosoma equiperdum]